MMSRRQQPRSTDSARLPVLSQGHLPRACTRAGAPVERVAVGRSGLEQGQEQELKPEPEPDPSPSTRPLCPVPPALSRDSQTKIDDGPATNDPVDTDASIAATTTTTTSSPAAHLSTVRAS